MKHRIWNRNFFLLWQGGTVSALGDQSYLIASMLWAKQATESGTSVGLILFAGGITSLLIPFGGVLADRFPRVRLLVLFDLLSGLSVLTLAVLFFTLPSSHPFLIPALVLTNFTKGIYSSLFYPVTNALLPDLVPAASLTRANSIMQMTQRLTVLVGQSLGGFLFRVLGAPLLLLIDGISFLLSAVTELFIREPTRAHTPAKQEKIRPLQDLREGFRFASRVRGFRLYMLEASCVNFLLASLFVSFPFYVEDVLKVSVDWYGYLLAAMGFGGVLGGLIGGRFAQPGVLRGTTHIICLVILSSSLLPLSLVRSPWAAMAILIVAWACAGFHQVILTTIVQKRIPSEFRGRVFGILTLIRNGLMPIGAAVFGILIDQTGGDVAQLFFWAGTGALVIILLAASRSDWRAFFTGDESEIPLIEKE